MKIPTNTSIPKLSKLNLIQNRFWINVDRIESFAEHYTVHASNTVRFDTTLSRQRFATPSSRRNWTLGENVTLEEFDRRVAQGWPDMASKVEALAASIKQPTVPRNVRRRMTRGAQGDTLDISEVYAGRLDRAWLQSAKAQGLGPRNVTILARLDGASSEAESRFLWRGVAALVLADTLTTAGYNVQILSVTCGDNVRRTREGIVAIYPVKTYQDPLNLSMLASSLCQVGVFRLTMFQLMCSLNGKVTDGLGRTLSNEDFEPVRTLIDPDAISIDHNISSETSMLSFVNNAIAKLQSTDTDTGESNGR